MMKEHTHLMVYLSYLRLFFENGVNGVLSADCLMK